MKISVTASAVGADLALGDGVIGLSAGTAIGDRVNLLYLQLAAFQQRNTLAVPVPHVDQVIRDNCGNLADL